MRVGRRGVVAVLGLAGVGLVVAVVGVVVAVVTPAGPLYTVEQVLYGLAHHPRAWVGRTITVRGTLVAAEGQDVSGGIVTGTWWASCRVPGCAFGPPVGGPYHIALVAHGPYRDAPALGQGPPPPLPPLPPGPRLVVLVRPHRPSPAWARFSRAVRQAATTLPDGSWYTLAHLPLLGPLFGQLLMPTMVPGGTPRLYRVRLLPPVPAARRASCALVCDDGVLLGNLQ